MSLEGTNMSPMERFAENQKLKRFEESVKSILAIINPRLAEDMGDKFSKFLAQIKEALVLLHMSNDFSRDEAVVKVDVLLETALK